MVVVDGTNFNEAMDLKRGFEQEGALVLIATPQPDLIVEALKGDEGERSHIVVDLPFDAVAEHEFEGLLLPEGVERVEGDEALALERLVNSFYRRNRPIFASGRASQFLEGDVPFAKTVVVREGSPIEGFMKEAVNALMDTPSQAFRYRATAAS